MRNYYTDYVNHCLRFYARHPQPTFNTELDKKNWVSCDNALKTFNDKDREMLIEIYREGDTIPDNVYQMSQKLSIKQDTIWKLITDLEKKVAKKRGLI